MQGYRGELYLYVKHVLRVDTYFQVLALFKSFQLQLPSKVIKQRMQTSNEA
jgi:hypothetical protein